MAKNAVCPWDFTLSQKGVTVEELKTKLKDTCKSWCFQLEKGKETDYLHYQGRVSLKVKSRKGPALFPGIHWSPTSKANQDNMFYVTKDDTRVEGPWADTDKEIYIPKQYRDIKLYPYQQQIIDSRNIFDVRCIDAIIDFDGNNGKSTVAALGEILYGGIDCPAINDCTKLVQYVYNYCMDNDVRDPKLIFMDLPRAMNKESLYGMYSAIEQLKKGKLVDDRNHGKCWWIDAPRVWVFSNHVPDLSLMSTDRWRLWTINKDTKTLERFLGDSKLSVTLPKKRIL